MDFMAELLDPIMGTLGTTSMIITHARPRPTL